MIARSYKYESKRLAVDDGNLCSPTLAPEMTEQDYNVGCKISKTNLHTKVSQCEGHLSPNDGDEYTKMERYRSDMRTNTLMSGKFFRLTKKR